MQNKLFGNIIQSLDERDYVSNLQKERIKIVLNESSNPLNFDITHRSHLKYDVYD